MTVKPLVYDHKYVATMGLDCLRCGEPRVLHVGAFRRWRWRREEARYQPCACGCGRTCDTRMGWDGYHGA